MEGGGDYYKDIYVKVNIAEQLEKQLKSPYWKGEEIGISGVTDCYQPIEAKYGLMSEILKVLIKYKNPCSITTKSDLILRDYDLIDQLSRVAYVGVNASISTMDDKIRKKIEPGGKNASEKFNMLKEFSKINVTTGMLHMPIIPYITDSRENIEQLYANAADSKIDFIVTGALYLRGKTRKIFFDNISREFPELLAPLKHLYRNGGADRAYKSSLYQIVHELKRKYGLSSDYFSARKNIVLPEADDPAQISLFEDRSAQSNYQSSPIPTREQLEQNRQAQASNQKPKEKWNADPFVEVEMGQETTPAREKISLIPATQPIETVVDERRALFYSMRNIARDIELYGDSSKIFYEQAIFMKDYEDDYSEIAPFSSYFPYYQRMNYEQLRTYFTWRGRVRRGEIEPISPSYAFVYIYELLNQIGINNPEEGLAKLMAFWQAFRVHNDSIDQYVLQWLKDYHIYYPLQQSFHDFVEEHGLKMHYPAVFAYNSCKETSFDLFASISKYDITQSVFYSEETHNIINDCFHFTLTYFRKYFEKHGSNFEDMIFHPLAEQSPWMTFGNALFHPVFKQANRRVVISEREVYNCKANNWQYTSVMLADQGRQLIGYIMKEMESCLRKVVKFKYKMSANPNVCGEAALNKLSKMGIKLPDFIQACVTKFYAEFTRKVIEVDAQNLNEIRKQAMETQEKLIVPEADGHCGLDPQSPPPPPQPKNVENPWEALVSTLTQIELQAIQLLLQGQPIKSFALQSGIMLEVLVDNINEKAMEAIGDAILELDEEIVIYDEYKTSLLEVINL